MLCPSVFQPSPVSMSPVSMSPFLGVRWPVRSLWPEMRPLFFHLEQEMLRQVQEMKQSMEFMERLHQKIFDQIDRSSPSDRGVSAPVAFLDVGRGSGRFALSLDAREFSPEELSVTQVGRKLRVSGRTEKKQEGGEGSYSYRCQEFRQEIDLPEGVEPQAITCCMLGGRLQIQAPRETPLSHGEERVVPIRVTSAPAITSSSSESKPAEKN